MPPLPVVSGKELGKVIAKCGWVFKRQNGSHMIYKHPDALKSISIPNHKTIDRGLLKRIINDANLTVDKFINLL
ncbi:MAG: type II toxin-antitoxin system HicA family toxin [Alkaliphilus sp.]